MVSLQELTSGHNMQLQKKWYWITCPLNIANSDINSTSANLDDFWG